MPFLIPMGFIHKLVVIFGLQRYHQFGVGTENFVI
jgi:hypothetical protein